MLNPTSASKTPLSSRVAMPIALLMAGGFGLGISILQPTSIFKKSAVVAATAPAAEAVPAPRPAQNPSAATQVSSANELVSFCSRHVTEKRSFVVFKRGTCVVINEPCKDPMKEARRILAECKDVEAKFLTELTSDGDMIVAFKDPVFHRFSKSELEKLTPSLKQASSILLTPAESVAAGDGWIPPGNARIGLLARRRMLEDAANAVPVKVIRARERDVVAR